MNNNAKIIVKNVSRFKYDNPPEEVQGYLLSAEAFLLLPSKVMATLDLSYKYSAAQRDDFEKDFRYLTELSVQ